MNKPSNNKTNSFSRNYSREIVKKIVFAAFESGNYKFAKEAINLWLLNYQEDIEFKYDLAYVLYFEKRFKESIDILDELINRDPEFVKPYELLLNMMDETSSDYHEILGYVSVLNQNLKKKAKLPEWVAPLLTAKQALDNGLYQEAEQIIQKVLGNETKYPLPAVVHMRAVEKGNDETKNLNLSTLYHSRWPACITFSLIHARSLLETEHADESMDLLNRCIINDPSGQVIHRIWPITNPFKSMWPVNFEIDFDIPIPADVANILGWNALPEGDTNEKDSVNYGRVQEINRSIKTKPEKIKTQSGNRMNFSNRSLPMERKSITLKESLKTIDDTFFKLEKKLNKTQAENSRKDTRYPIYVIMTVRNNLVEKYGEQTTEVINSHIRMISEKVREKKKWGSIVFFPDDQESMNGLELNKIDEFDPWSIKLALVDLENSLAKKGAMIGALLIIGNDDIVPFHRLPNPTDDADDEILSDNPYCSLDANYFVPEWPVGRLPGDTGADAGVLLSQIRTVSKNQSTMVQSIPWWVNINLPFNWWQQIQNYLNQRKYCSSNSSIGYSAAVWRRSSISVFRPIGQGQNLHVSPPVNSTSFDENRLNQSDIGYFNLHGLIDSSEWYGQKDIYDNGKGPDYPIALKASEIKKNGRSPQVVFSEACYGGHIEGKTENDSVALKLLSIGTPALVASTSISYGSIASPLIGADLLGYLFFRSLKEGLTSGEALMKAKIDFVREMNKRQEFLDGEDQKTLISFCLYGDPLGNVSECKFTNKNLGRFRYHQPVNTISDKNLQRDSDGVVGKHIIEDVKTIVEEYLPGLDHEYVLIKSPMKKSTPAPDEVTMPEEKDHEDRVLITFKKQVKMPNNVHNHYARATLDGNGKIIKLAISR